MGELEDIGLLQMLDDDDEIIPILLQEVLREDGERSEIVFVDREGWRTLSNFTFKQHFRMDRVVFARLIDAVGNHLLEKNRLLRLRTPLDLYLLMGLWPVFNQDTFRSGGTTFGVNRSVIYFHYCYILEALREMAGKYIKWPGPVERDEIKTSFEERYGYPGCVGCIDGVHIKITAPLEEPQRYVNRHHQHSILVQAVCDHNLMYRDIYVGEVGGLGDTRTYQRSPLSRNLLVRPDMLSDGEHILGDGAHVLTSKILVPYPDDGHLTDEQRTHKYILSRVRASVERSFALMREKNRRLKGLPTRNMLVTIDHIVASMVLHNFIILEGYECDGIPANEGEYENVDWDALTMAARHEGALKREHICEMLNRDL